MSDLTGDPNPPGPVPERALPVPRPRFEQVDRDAGDGAAGGPRRGDEPGIGGIGLTFYLRALYRRRWLALTVFVLVAIAGTMRAYSLVPVYEARVRLLLDSERLNIVAFQDVVERPTGSTTYLQTQLMILQSRSLARRTMRALRLLPPAVPPSDSSAAQPVEPAVRRLGGAAAPAPAPSGWLAPVQEVKDDIVEMLRSVGARPATPAAPDASPAVDEAAALSRRIDGFLSGMRVTPVPNSDLVDVRYQSTDPAVAAEYANAIAHQYIEQSRELRFVATKEATDWLSERLTEQRQKVEATEQALLDYRRRTGFVAGESGDDVALQKLSDLTKSVTDATASRIEKEALFRQLEALQRDGANLEAFPNVLDSQAVQQLKIELANLQRQYAQLSQQLGDRHPTMLDARAAIQTTQARLQAEIGRIAGRVRADYIAAREAENSLLQAFESQKREALAQNAQGVELGVLQREAESNRGIYDVLMQRAKETDITNELRPTNIQILDAAERPRAPFAPNRTREIRMALLWALVAAVGLAIGVEMFDNRIKSPDDIQAYLHLPLLGLIPAVKPKKGGSATPLLSTLAPGNFSEAFRMFRTNVLFSAADDKARVLVVTSASQGEGKTAVASNLAISIAQAGQRVLIIDGDMRRPCVHRVLGCKLEPGLSNLIVGTTKASEVVQQSSVPGLWVLPGGMVPPNAAELLGSHRFRSLLAGLQGHFDWVIVDSPPVMAVTDAAVIANVVARCIFVVGADMTSRTAAASAIERLERVGALVVGGVLNRAETHRHKYYYAPYYRQEYGAYYTKPDAAG